MRISFNGDDDGCVERLATLSDETQSGAVEIEEISADNSGRSFFIKTSDGSVSYFWCCEKSKLLGEELLSKMKDFLSRNLSLAKLTGISESRLNYFASELRGAYLSGSTVTVSNPLSVDPPSENSFSSSLEHHQSSTSHQATTSKASQDDSNLLREGSSSSIFVNSSSSSAYVASSFLSPDNAELFDSDLTEKQEPLKTTSNESYPFPGTFGELPECPLFDPNFQILPSSASSLSPLYCWCPPPPAPSTHQYSIGNSSSTDSLLPLPPLSSLLLSPSTTSLNLGADLQQSLDYPSTSGYIPTFTPLMCCDPIVHVPLIDVCSSGPGYLVSAGPASLSATLSPDPKSDPTVESSACETLRMLLSSSESSMMLVGSRGLYSGTLDVVGFSASRSENPSNSDLDSEIDG